MKNKILSILLVIAACFSAVAQEITNGGYNGFKVSGNNDDFPDIIIISARFTTGGICIFSTTIDNKETPLTGRYHIIVRSDKYVIANINKGILEGEWTKYNSSNQVIEKAFFKKGCYDGEFHIYGNGRETYTFKDCRMTHYIAYHSNDKLKVERNYENEKLHGAVKEYNENGDLIEEVYYQNGKRHGKRVSVIYSDEHTVTEHYNNGVLEGEYMSAYNNGTMIEKGTYDANGKKTGRWTRWNRDGELNNEADYLDGKYHGELKSYHKNKLRTHIEYANGQYHGRYLLYYDYPAIREDIYYKEGVRHGSYKQYAETGKLILETIYENSKKAVERIYHMPNDGSTESFYQNGQVVKRKVYDKNGNVKSLSLLNEKGDLVVVQEYNTTGKVTKTNKDYRKNASITLKEDASGIIDIE